MQDTVAVCRWRVDIGEDWLTGASYLHKLWPDGSEERFRLEVAQDGGTIRTVMSKEEWEKATAGLEPVPCSFNSAWGDGRAVPE